MTNPILGTETDDLLIGTPGSDLIDGGAGFDTLVGGQGNDSYIIRDGDIVFELPNEGTDIVFAYTNYRLTDYVENLQMIAGVRGEGNSEDNLIQGNAGVNELFGYEGNDVLEGFGGDDKLYGGSGNDRLFGGDGNDLLVGGPGFDQLYGGRGNDTYLVSSYRFRIVEPPRGGGNDTIVIPLDYELKSLAFENLKLYGGAQFGTGNRLKNRIEGNGRGNVLSGLAGNDTLLGNGGNDRLFGSTGNDQLFGGDSNDELFGQQGNDRLSGDRGNDVLYGEDGNDVLIGYGGVSTERDRLFGGAGADTFVLGARGKNGRYYLGSGFAVIGDFSQAQRDKIQVRGNPRSYRLDNSRNLIGNSSRDTAIYLGSDLIAIVQDNAGVTTSNLFTAPRLRNG
ncbi:MAG: hypothetical protein Fur0046_21710 [Cyanobacteria bacterium J069]|nr:MAG: calcium-binding protein [Cyanobacteria bacterium J069]